MQNDYLQNLPPHERRLILQQEATKIENGEYLKPLTAEELDIKREEFTEVSITLGTLDEKKKEAVAGFKAEMEPLQLKAKELLYQVRTKQEKKVGTLYHLANHTSSMMETYDENGEIVATRRLRHDEKQGTIFSLPSRSVANGE